MEGVDPDTLLEWLQTGVGDERDIQLMALEQLCMLLLMSDNIDQCFESCPPRTFLPALCKIFLDETATENVLEVTARAITYYLDVSNECTRRITQVDGAVKAICNRLAVAEMSDRTSKDLAEQCVKLLEHICQRETSAVYDAGGLQCMLTLVRQHGQYVHKDTVHSAMSVITRLCSKMEPNDSTIPECSASLGALLEHDDSKVSECALRCFAALTDRFIRKFIDPVEMVQHGNLVEHLLNSLIPTHLIRVAYGASPSHVRNANSVESSDSLISPLGFGLNRPASFTSIVISLLSNLCRGSSTVTEQIISSPVLFCALKSILMSKDERCIMDALRLCDLLMVLLCEGRSALPKNMGSSLAIRNETGPNSFDRSHRHLIDAIRQRDTDALIDAVESGQVDANFADDVGQTLLNWSSAFGTLEMVTYLCDKGADVNKGQRSSSLHYAACFGRSDIVKILLKYGANPDLRDEEGKTALDKARERNEEEHQLIACILESPSAYMQRVDEEKEMKEKSDVAKQTASEKIDPAIVRRLLEQLLPVLCDIYQRSLSASIHRSSLSLLRRTIHHISSESMESMVTNDNSGVDVSIDICFSRGQRLAENLVSVLMMGLEHEDDTESHENVLQIIKSLFMKNRDFWLEQLVRVGIFEKVEAIANQPVTAIKGSTVTMVIDESDRISKPLSVAVMDNLLAKADEVLQGESSDVTNKQQLTTNPSKSCSDKSKTPSTVISSIKEKNDHTAVSVYINDDDSHDAQITSSADANAMTPLPTLELSETNSVTEVTCKHNIGIDLSSAGDDQWEIVQDKSYRWKDWRLIKSRDSFFIWCDAVAVEFSDGSNGWFRFMLDGHLSTMYSSGSPEAGSDNAETRGEFLDKLTKARNAVPPGSLLHSIFSIPDASKTIEVGSWVLTSPKIDELTITNRDGNQQRLIIVEDLPGFVFESNRQTKHCFQAERTLGLDFVTGWTARGEGRNLCFRAETQKAKLREMAKEIWNNYLKEAQSKPRDALVELQKASFTIKEICQRKNGRLPRHMLSELEAALKCMRSSVVNDRLLSAFELSISGIVDALLAFLKFVQKDTDCEIAVIFRTVFVDQRSLSALVRKMVSILDAIEKFPQYLYDTPGGSSFGLQLLNRRIKLKLEQFNPNTLSQMQLLNRSGRTMKIEPLSTVKQLKCYILRMVAKQWYDQGRETFHFVEEIRNAKKHGTKISFTYTSDFDDRGIIYWLGTNGKTTEWTNPASVHVVFVTSSEGERLPYGQHEDILSRDALNCHTSDDKNAYFTIDLGVYFYPNTYTLRHARGYGRSALRNWLLQASHNGQIWDVLVVHENDTSLNYPGSTATWPVVCSEGPYRYIRIAQNGKNASNQNHYLSLSGFEIYGDIVDVVVDDFNMLEEKPSVNNRRSKKCISSTKEISMKENSTSEAPLASTTADVRIATSRNDASVVYLPGGQTNNKVISGVVGSDLMLSATNVIKNRTFRCRRGSRLLAANIAGRGVRVANVPDAMVCPVGSRVVRGPDWKWDNQGSNMEGTIISIIDNGWVDVQWDDCTSNSYRFGADGKYDIELKSVEWTPGLLRGFRIVGARRESHAAVTLSSTDSNQVPPGFARQLPPVPRGFMDYSPTRTSRKAKPGGTSFSQYHQSVGSRNNAEIGGFDRSIFVSCIHCGSQEHHAEDCVNALDCSNSQKSKINAEKSESNPDAKVITTNQLSSTIAQKSMSTTNLFDGSEAEKRASVASTNQAASAESLQHQTPSLENLLARSKIFDDHIPEVISDDILPIESQHTVGFSTVGNKDQESVSPNNYSGLGTSFENFDGAVTAIEETHDGNVSLKTSTYVSGSQSVLLDEDRETFGRTQVIKQRNTCSYPQNSVKSIVQNNAVPVNNNIRSLEEANARNLANLSVSAPNLVVLRQLQQSRAVPNTDEVCSDDDLVRNILQDLANDPLRLRNLRRFALAGSGSAMINESDNVDEVRGRGVDESFGALTHDIIRRNAQMSNEVNDRIDAVTPIVDSESNETRQEGGWKQRKDLSSIRGNTLPLESVKISLVPMMLQSFNAGRRIITEEGHHEAVTGEISIGDSAVFYSTDHKASSSSCSRKQFSEEDVSDKIEASMEAVGSNHLDGSQKASSKSSFGTGFRPTSGTQSAACARRNMQINGSSFRSRLGSYADVLRTVVMQQIIDSSGSLNGLELEEIEDDMYDDEMQDEGNEDDCDEEYGNGLSVEALAQAAAALRRQSSGTSNGSSGELKLNWKQIVMGEAGRLIGDRSLRVSTSPSENKQSREGRNRNWDDEFVLKHQLPALIPAFDPRPGRTNVNQTQDVELPQDINESQNEAGSPSACSVLHSEEKKPELRLYLQGPNLANISNVTVELDDDDRSIFFYLQQLVQSVEWGQKNERIRRVWEPTYTLIYGDARDNNELPQTVNKKVAEMNSIPENVARTLVVLSSLYQIATNLMEYEIMTDIFISEKLTQKLMQELADPLIVSARALPSWCDELIFKYPCLFSVETRNNYFRATAFGTSRSIVWLQTRHDQMLEQSRGAIGTGTVSNLAGTRREDHYPEFRIGRIKHERIKVPRNDEQLFEYAIRLLEFHASRKAVLEVEYIDEEGTGLGPTLEFYALMGAEFQRKGLAMWICDDADTDQTQELDLGEGMKPPGYYVRRSGGLFPAALPVSSVENSRVSKLFRIFGIFLAKVLQDGRLVDLPLSQPFLKMITNSQLTEEKMPDLSGVLTLDDLEEVFPDKGRILKELARYVEEKRSTESDHRFDRNTRQQQIQQLKLSINGSECRVEDLALTFCVNPSSTVFSYKQMELIKNGANIDVTADNVELYVAACTNFYLNSGILNQLKAFREGFDLVFPLRNLRMFIPRELQTLLSGDQCPEWTREDVINFTEPKLGYTKESPGFLRFVDVLVEMNASERKSFLQFTTGCSSLPPGGLANLHPRLTIVRKVDSGDGSYPSVNTCVHYLKLPDYSSAKILRERLLTATNEKGFHLN